MVARMKRRRLTNRATSSATRWLSLAGRPTPAGLAAAADATRRAIANHALVAVSGCHVGFADFLIRDGHRYQC